ncbi:MAG: tyrosine-protein phosphatase, partial [Rhizobiaceae bacterium]|nr:tyrosine-protein phosphatase [Rhizobiaceae bacterium]
MEIHANRHLPIEGTFNIRDLGGYPAGEAETLWRRVLRADGLHRIDEAGRDALVALGIKTVIDL